MVWEHFSFSQRATWPPSSTVRQRSIALMTFTWSRLTCPALARRHAAPWSRKISATSSAGRDMAAGRYAGGWSFLLFFGFFRGGDSKWSGRSLRGVMPVATGGAGALMEQADELAGGHRLAGLAARKQPTFLKWRCGIVTWWARLPPLAQQIERLGRQHDMAVLAALGLLDANDLLRPVDMLDLQPHHLAGA